MSVGSQNSWSPHTAQPGVTLGRYNLKYCPEYVKHKISLPSMAQGMLPGAREWKNTVVWVPLVPVQIPLCVAVMERKGKKTFQVGKNMELSVMPLVSFLSGQLGQDTSCLWPGYKLA